MKPLLACVLTIGFIALVACSEDNADDAGASGAACSGDDGCADSQVCLDGVCVAAADAGADAGMDAETDGAAQALDTGQVADAGEGCERIISCINACPSEDQGPERACSDACIDAGSALAQVEFDAIVQCATDACSDVSADGDAFAECQLRSCGDEIEACTGRPTGVGSASCAEVIDCILTCTDDRCADACVATGLFSAQSLAVTFYQCGVAACPNLSSVDEFLPCARAACADDAAACLTE